MTVYNQLLKTCFFSPVMVGVLDTSLANCVHYRGGFNACIDLYLQADTDHRIQYARFKARGNPYLLAGAEYVCHWLQGKDLSLYAAMDHRHVMEELDIPYAYQSTALLIANTANEAVYELQKKCRQYP